MPNPVRDPLLHLDVAVRQIRSVEAVAWVDALLGGRPEAAHAIGQRCDPLPFLLTRDLAAARRGARALARGNRRAGMLASSGGRRLRAEGLGAELPHMDEAAVAHWFLDSFPPDVRAANALEQVATEFSCQGLELDVCLLCWDADLVQGTGGRGWVPRNFRGTRWQAVHGAEAVANQLNTYRVLLTRARYETIIFVPAGDAGDPTRDPGVYDRIAAHLRDAGVPWLGEVSLPVTEPERVLL
ncbi:MAG: DNA/RNA helicase domain-containing protein [Rhodospirillales bacterium]